MEEKEKREATAAQERAVGILIGLSANKELIESIKKDSA